MIVVTQTYDNHLVDSAGAPIPGSETVGLGITHTLTYADARIVKWVQVFDADRVGRARAAAEAHTAAAAAIKVQAISRGRRGRSEVAGRTFSTTSLRTALGAEVPMYNLPLEAKYTAVSNKRVAETRSLKATWSAGTPDFAPPPELEKTIEPKGGASDNRLLRGKSRQLVQGYLAGNHPVFGTAHLGY